MLHGGFAFFNPANLSHAGTKVQVSGETVELVWRADGVDVDPAVVDISYPASDTDFDGQAFHEPAEADALHAAGDVPFASCMVLV